MGVSEKAAPDRVLALRKRGLLMWDRVQFKATGKARFKANYWPYVAASVVLALVGGHLFSYVKNGVEALDRLVSSGLIQMSPQLYDLLHPLTILTVPFVLSSGFLGLAFTLLVGNPYSVGASRFFLENDGARKPSFDRVAFGFTADFGNVVLTMLLRSVFIFLWSLLLIIPGIIRSYGYFAVPYILAENPGMDWNRALKLSLAMTQGHKWDIFVTHLSFLGWLILSAVTFQLVGAFYAFPYMDATNTEMYRWLRQEALRNRLATDAELPGTGPVFYQA